jgi:hypothetical protein
MALLSVSDVLLFFSLLMNAIAIAKPRGGLVSTIVKEDTLDRKEEEDFRFGNQAEDIENSEFLDTEPLLAHHSPQANHDSACGEQLERLNKLLISFRRGGVFIATWNIALMLLMVFVLN